MKPKVTITIQNYGTAILCFICGETYEDAYGKYLSLYNWNATSSDPRVISDKVISCWSTLEKYRQYLWNLHENRLWHNRPNDCQGEMDIEVRAYHLMQQDLENTPHESFRSVNAQYEMAEFGVIQAEKPDDDFKDAVLKHAFA